jgi:hypothetical protein
MAGTSPAMTKERSPRMTKRLNKNPGAEAPLLQEDFPEAVQRR